MGTWGTAINSNDSYSDIYEEFIDLYNEGHTVKEITHFLIKENSDQINDTFHSNDFWFAIAMAQWECKELDPEVFLKVKEIIDSGSDLRNWKTMDASAKDLKAREKALNSFLDKLQTEKKTARKRIKKKLFDSVYKAGDCLTYKLSNGNYGGAFVITGEVQSPVAKNFIAITTIDQPDKPVLTDFKKSTVLAIQSEETKYEILTKKQYTVLKEINLVGIFNQYDHKLKTFEIEVIGNLPTNNTFTPGNPIHGYAWSRLQYPVDPVEKNKTILINPQKVLKINNWLR
jgi:hypothetical protein